MRGLNLSRLAARGRAAEGMHSAKAQSEQAAALRAKLTPSEVASLQGSASAATPTVDVLGTISGQSALARLALARARAEIAAPLPRVVTNAIPDVLTRTVGTATPAQPAPLRALGANKYALYQRVAAAERPSRPLPGGDKYAEGATVGVMSLTMATAVVGSVGAVGIGALYLHPTLVDDMKYSTKRFRETVDAGVGERLRGFAGRMREEGVLAPESVEKARRFASRVAGVTAGDGVEGREEKTERYESKE